MMLISHLSLLISTFMVCLQLVFNKAQQPTPVEPLLQLITCATSAHSDIDSSQCLNPLQYYSGNQVSWYAAHAKCHSQGLALAAILPDGGSPFAK